MAQQRVVLVAGGTGGLGGTISTPMADAGDEVVVISLASEEAAFVIGANIAINGGQHMQ